MTGGGAAKPFSLRVRLALALAFALAPVLLLGVIQSSLAFSREAEDRRANLAAAAERSAVMAEARLQSATILLDTLTASSVGVQCTSRLRQLMDTTGGFANLIRLDAGGRVRCAADSVLGGRERRDQSWFRKLAAGERFVIDTAPNGLYAGRPAVLAAVRGVDAAGAFDGAAVALIRLDSLKPATDRTMPKDTQVAVVNREGRLLTETRPGAFAAPPPGFAAKATRDHSLLYYGRSKGGSERVFSLAPLLEDQVFVVLSAPAPNPLSWARLNILSSVLLPVFAFLSALAAVWVVTERVIVRWLHYLERIAAIYARGRFSVRPVKAVAASPEIRRLAGSLSQMADALVARDVSLH
ncbi:MAG: sensor histidine kinase, partial [Caulobacteraceae bacterium]